MANFIETVRNVGTYRASEVAWAVTSKWYRADGTRRGIIWCHGATISADSDWLVQINYNSTQIRALALAGYPVVVADLCAAAYSYANWGNDDLISAVGAAKTYLTGTMGAKTDKVGLYGGSMGTLGLAWVRANLSSVFAAAFNTPVLDVDDIYQNNKGGLRATVGTAYGVTYPTSLGSLATHSPVAFGASDLAGLKLKMWPSSNDPVASTTTQVNTWGGKGATLTVVDLGAVGHDGSTTPTQDVVQFFDDSGGRS